MKLRLFHINSLIAVLILAVIFFGCNDTLDVNDPQFSNGSETQKFLMIAEKSSSVNSFTPNYDEEQAMALAGTLGKDLYPIHIGQKMKLVNRNLTLIKDSTTATGTLVQNYEGRLIITGSFQPPTVGIRTRVDTTIEKLFSTTITRVIQYKRVANTGNDTLDWKVDWISLPNGGTTGDNIHIVKLILTTQDGTEVVIDDPSAYFFKVGKEKSRDDDDEDEGNQSLVVGFGVGFGNHNDKWKNLLTWYKRNQPVKLTVEILSNTSDPDLLTVTYGAMMNGNSRKKEKFDFVSSTQEGTFYRKVYERKLYTHSHAVRMHAVINAFPRHVVYDTETSVEVKTWGIPYRVK